MAMLNTACAGKFSSDRTIEEYAKEIWKLRQDQIVLYRVLKYSIEYDKLRGRVPKGGTLPLFM